MTKYRKERNWSEYNQKLKNIASIEFYISEEAIKGWYYCGKRLPGGKLLYSDVSIELCLLMKEYYKLAYRQTQGFVESIFKLSKLNLKVADYSTISRRAAKLEVSIRNIKSFSMDKNEAIVVAIDSTGLSLYQASQWHQIKHKNTQARRFDKWRKLHVIIDVHSGEILESKYSKANVNDPQELGLLLSGVNEDITAFCGYMAYDTLDCRRHIMERKARQLIPPKKSAVVSVNNKYSKKYSFILRERDEALNYINHNQINGDSSLARKSWKEKSGYHARSLVETTIWQIKKHTSNYLTNKREDTRNTQSRIKCKIINLIQAA